MPGSGDDDGLISIASALTALGLDVSNNYNIKVEKLSGGLTNDNILVVLHDPSQRVGRKIVIRRFLTSTSSHLGYDRQQEYDNSQFAAKEKNVGAPVIGYVPSTAAHGGALAVEFIESKTMDEDLIQSMCSTKDGVSRLVAALKKVHDGLPLFQNHFDPFKAREQYEKEVQIMTGNKIAWDGYEDVVKKLKPIQEYLERSTEILVDCHNDLLGANFLDTESNLTIIDWELSGQAEPSWELGNFISENELDGHLVSSLIAQYWSGSDPTFIAKKIKKAKLFSLVSKITWAAWGGVLHNLDREDAFDYQEWCMQRLDKARLLLDDQNAIKELCSE